MERFVWNVLILLAILTAILPSTKSTFVQVRVYRPAGKDVFKNPEYSSYTECGLTTCAKYQAECLEDGNCCMCRCSFKFSTYNVSEGRCVSDTFLQTGI